MRCFVPFCHQKKQDGVKMHRFSDCQPWQRAYWSDWALTIGCTRKVKEDSVLCSRHFEESHFAGNGLLKEGAFPTLIPESLPGYRLFLASSVEDIISEKRAIFRKYEKFCAVESVLKPLTHVVLKSRQATSDTDFEYESVDGKSHCSTECQQSQSDQSNPKADSNDKTDITISPNYPDHVFVSPIRRDVCDVNDVIISYSDTDATGINNIKSMSNVEDSPDENVDTTVSQKNVKGNEFNLKPCVCECRMCKCPCHKSKLA